MSLLTRDPVEVPGQRFAVVSFVGPQATQKAEKLGMKIRGVFATKDEADKHAADLIKLDPSFDIYVTDMYQWCLIPPDPTAITDVHYQDQQLNDLIRGHFANQKAAKEYFEERKAAILREGLDANLLESEKLEPPEEPTC